MRRLLRRSTPFFAVAAWLIVSPLAAQDARPLDIAPTPLQNDFRGKLTELQASLDQLNGKIAESAKQIDALSDPAAARAEIDKLQGYVADALAAVADNGQVAILGRKALDFAKGKLASVQGSKFAPDERDTLVKGWGKIAGDLETENKALGSVRGEFAGLLRTIQQRADYFAELQALDDGQRMLDVVRDLADRIRQTSEQTKAVLRASGKPGS